MGMRVLKLLREKEQRERQFRHQYDLCALVDLFMQTVYVAMVYTLNMLICYAAENAMDVVLNSLALEFIHSLDNEFKERYFEFYIDVESSRAAGQIHSKKFEQYGRRATR